MLASHDSFTSHDSFNGNDRGLGWNVARTVKAAVLGVALLGLGGCGTLTESKILTKGFWAAGPFAEEGRDTKYGLAELVRGNSWAAVRHFEAALRADPRDPHALLGSGMAFQNLGQFTRARAKYEEVIAVRPSSSVQMMVWRDAQPMHVTVIAGALLASLDAGETGGASVEIATSPTGGGARPSTGVMPPQYAPAPVQARPLQRQMAPRPAETAAVPAQRAVTADLGLAATDQYVIRRFDALRLLRDEGLITPNEYRARRNVNVGALLPLTSPPPANGLDQPVPSGRQISGRLLAIARALEAGAMTVPQHAAERAMILDALMPEAPIAVAYPGRPPKGLMEAADAVRRLEAVRAAKLITSDEYMRERKAIGTGLYPKPRAAPVQTGRATAAATVATPVAAGGLGVHLASYRTKATAERGWRLLRRTHQTLLGGLAPTISRIDLGPGKGIYYRLKAGPVLDQGTARALCTKLKRRGQYCTPSLLG